MKGILIVDHGSRVHEANDMLRSMADLIQTIGGPDVVVRYAHMELADPDIAAGFASCVHGGASEVIVFPYMLSPGRHSTSDIPRMVADAAKNFPSVNFAVTPAFGLDEKLAAIVLGRALSAPLSTEQLPLHAN
jgi:sirohydrochlorin ferrochelatase